MFISYRHDDVVIATALQEALIEINRNRVDCFLDCKSIGVGEGWEKKLDDALGRVDWLVCIYTGKQSEYCGYEIGVFTRAKAGCSAAGDYRLVCLHYIAELLGIFRAHQNAFVTSPPASLVTASPAIAPSAWSRDESDFYSQSGVFAFLEDSYAYRGLYVPRDTSEQERQREVLLAATNRITLALMAAHGSDIKTDTPTQLALEVSFTPEATQAIAGIPDAAIVTGTFGSFALFGLMPAMQNRQLPSTIWADLNTACQSRSVANALWMSSLEREMVNVANGRLLGTPEAVFLSATASKTYRPILVRHTVLLNGTHRFEIVFVETLPRQFVGYQKTSLLLAGLVQASRFRFSYLEEPDRVAALFDDARSDAEFAINCRQLRYDIERIQSEGLELRLLDPQAFIAAFGESRRALAKSFREQWKQAKGALLAHLPQDEPPRAQDRAKAKGSIATFLQGMTEGNRPFVLAALHAYREEVARQQ